MAEKLTDDQKKRFAEWVNSKTPLIGKCSVCGHREWTILDDILEVRPFNGGGMVIGGPVYPYVALFCTNCTNTQFLSAIATGVLNPNATSGDTPDRDVKSSDAPDD